MLITVLSCFLLAIFAPLISRIGRGYTGWIIGSWPFVLFAVFINHIKQISSGDVISVSYNWIPSLGINLSFYLDGLSLLFALLITGVGGLVFIYAGKYLAGHIFLGRFYLYISLFMGSMLGLVLSDNIFTIFIFWELTSVSSYLLIGFNNEREEARNAALQALLVTGLGGLALLAGMILLGLTGNGFKLSVLLSSGDLIRNHPYYLAILILVLIAAFTKSAQVPFHFWLPGAMEAPAPVSTYLHSATMVKAGIYLLARMSPILGDTKVWFYSLVIVGMITMITGVVLALQQNDLKRILAYSTVSVLGILTMLLGVGTKLAIQAAMVFLLGHALYKGALFLIAGIIDHETGTRDIRRLGGLWKLMPVVGIAGITAAISKSGLPPTFGFIGKELFYESVIVSQWVNPLLTVLLTVAAVFTSMLMFATAWISGISPFIGRDDGLPKKPHKTPFGMWIGAIILAVLGVVFGIVPGFIDHSIISPAVSAVAGRSVSVHLALWHGFNPALALSGLTIAGGFCIYYWWPNVQKVACRLNIIYKFMPENLYKLSLNGLLEVAGFQTRIIQSGYQRYYLLTIFSVTAILVWFILFKLGGIHGSIGLHTVKFYEVAFGLFILAAAVIAILSSSRLAAVAALGVVGYCISLIYVLYGAPDLAITQLLIETLTVILFVLVVYHLPRFSKVSSTGSRIRDAVVAIACGGAMTALVLKAGNIQFHQPISEYFEKNSALLAHGRNIVNVIIVDFRGFDTMGEITVLAVVGIGVYALLKLKIKPG
ncbi:MAG: putative monovalent cation/H+ antiporter subunit A [Candidatus Anammoxibacter sp.]